MGGFAFMESLQPSKSRALKLWLSC